MHTSLRPHAAARRPWAPGQGAPRWEAAERLSESPPKGEGVERAEGASRVPVGSALPRPRGACPAARPWVQRSWRAPSCRPPSDSESRGGSDPPPQQKMCPPRLTAAGAAEGPSLRPQGNAGVSVPAAAPRPRGLEQLPAGPALQAPRVSGSAPGKRGQEAGESGRTWTSCPQGNREQWAELMGSGGALLESRGQEAVREAGGD